MEKIVDLTGQVFGKWTVVEYAGIDKHGYSLYLCRCECGKEKRVLLNNLKRGASLSCRTCARMNQYGYTFNEGAFYKLYDRYKDQRRGRKFFLSLSEFRALTSSRCHWCGVEPKQIIRSSNYSGAYIYNGIDRLDNNIDYIISNCVPCCKRCNFAKRDATVEEWLSWLDRITTYQQSLKDNYS